MKYIVIVNFKTLDGMMDSFLPLILKNAADSIKNEPGCHSFDVVRIKGVENEVVLYETYADEAAFRLHCETSHFRHFEDSSHNMVESKVVVVGDLLGPTDTHGAASHDRNSIIQ